MSGKRIYSFVEDAWDVEKAIDAIRRNEQSVNSSSFYLCNLSDVVRKYRDWITKLPRVKPHYAVKCNDNLEVLKVLASLGCSFDCASSGEIKKILSLDVEPKRIIFANSTKIASHVEYAKLCDVNLMTFDNEDEVHKIAKHHPKSKLILRIRYVSEKAKYKLGKKFGCCPKTEAIGLLQLAKSFNLDVVGLSFHIGSSVEDYQGYCDAIEICKRLFVKAHDQLDLNLHMLDIGGGFPGDTFDKINAFAPQLNKCLDENFPPAQFPQLQIFSEPGRYFVESAFTLVSTIQSRKVTREPVTRAVVESMYYLNEGVYSSFLFVPLGPEEVTPKLLTAKRSDMKFKTTIWGPTCDSTDIICKDINLELLDIGDTLYFTSMGAYTLTLRTPFNGFDETLIFHAINSKDLMQITNCCSYLLDGADVIDLGI